MTLFCTVLIMMFCMVLMTMAAQVSNLQEEGQGNELRKQDGCTNSRDVDVKQ